MLSVEHVFKKGVQSQLVSDFLVENGFFFFAQKSYVFSEGVHAASDELSFFLKKLHNSLRSVSVNTLADFQKSVDDTIATYISGKEIDGVFALVREDKVYLVSIGEGKIFLKRGDDCALIIADDNKAVGKAQDKDVFVCGSGEILSAELIQKNLQAGEIELSLPQFDDVETILLIRLVNTGKEKIATIHHAPALKNKRFTIVIVIALCGILVWSVGFGLKRRMDAAFKKETKKYTLKITDALRQASEIAASNSDGALVLIDHAKKDLRTLERTSGTRKIPHIDELIAQIADAEKKITKKEEKQYDEFYDLALIAKEAKGNALFVDHDSLAVLDVDAGAVYLLSLSKKAVDTIQKDEIKGSGLISLYNDQLYIFKKGVGVYTLDKNHVLTLAISKDDQWGDISNIVVYNGNIYLLDSEKNDVYKYLVVENGYGVKVSYFKSDQTISFDDPHSIAIDSSLYVGVSDAVYKYTAGIRDEFTIVIPGDENPKFTALFTDRTVNKVYIWDKDQGKVFILSKQGSFEKQVESSILKKASHFIVREKNPDMPNIPVGIFVLVKDKIYTISLDPD